MSAEDTKVYDLDQVSCNFMGAPIESGYGEGAAISIEKVDPSFSVKQGADGSVVRSKTGKQLFKITITLLQTAAGNQVLSAINQADEAASNGAGIGPLLVADRGGTSLHVFAKAWIEIPPKVEYNAEASNREWILCGVKTVANVGSS